MRVGVIGTGFMGKNHCRVYKELGCDVHFFDTAPAAIEAAKAAGGKQCPTIDELLRNSDAVSVCTPTSTHRDIAIRCIEAGKHVLVEKPITGNVRDAEEIVSAAKKAGTIVMVGHIERFNPAINKLKEEIGKFGSIFSMSSKRLGSYPPRIQDCGVMVDLGIHDIDIMRWMSGSEIKDVYSITQSRVNGKFEDACSAILRFENGSIGNIEVNWLTPTRIRTFSFTSESAFGTVDLINQELAICENIFGKGYKDYKELLASYNPKSVQTKVEKAEPLKLELLHFLESVRSGRRPLVSGSDGIEALKAAVAALESAKRNVPVKTSDIT